MKTVLKNRILWWDGMIEVDPLIIPSLLLEHIDIDKIVSLERTVDTEIYEKITNKSIVGKSNATIPISIPLFPTNVDLYQILECEIVKRELDERYTQRVIEEFKEIEKRNLHNLFKCMHYLVNVLKSKNILWGVGRGSSCASLILYLLDVHMVDPIEFNIPLEEFFHD